MDMAALPSARLDRSPRQALLPEVGSWHDPGAPAAQAAAPTPVFPGFRCLREGATVAFLLSPPLMAEGFLSPPAKAFQATVVSRLVLRAGSASLRLRLCSPTRPPQADPSWKNLCSALHAVSSRSLCQAQQNASLHPALLKQLETRAGGSGVRFQLARAQWGRMLELLQKLQALEWFFVADTQHSPSLFKSSCQSLSQPQHQHCLLWCGTTAQPCASDSLAGTAVGM